MKHQNVFMYTKANTMSTKLAKNTMAALHDQAATPSPIANLFSDKLLLTDPPKAQAFPQNTLPT